MTSWKIGNVKITRLQEQEPVWPGTMVLKDATEDNVKREGEWLARFCKDNQFRLSIHALMLESEGRRILVDTCVGNDKVRPGFAEWNLMHLPFLSELEKAGVARDSIDTIVCTHLHLDHVGWNTMLVEGRWVPTFAKARYLIGRKEWAHWSVATDKFTRDPIDDSVRPVVDAGLAEMVEDTHRITDEVWLEPTPGHTPGHFSVRISSRGQDAVITGDLMHHPVQCAHPEWNCGFDSVPEQARATRRAFVERYADRPVLVFGTHFATPSAGYIVKDGASWRFRV